MKIKEFIIAIIAIAIIFLLPHSGIIPFPFLYCVPILLLIWFLLKSTNENFADIGFSFKTFTAKAFLIGLISGIVLFCFIQFVFFPLLSKIVPLQPANLNDFNSIRGKTGNYIFILIMGWFVGGVYEEIAFHGYIFSKIKKITGGKYTTAISFLITNLIFAFYHFQLGTSGIINAFLAGCAYLFLMLYFKNNMWYATICHAVFDTIALTFIYAGYW